VVKEERLDKMRPVDLEGHFLEEVLHIQIVLSDDIDDEVVAFDWLIAVEIQSVDGIYRESEALEWVETVLRLGNVIDDHHRIRELTISIDEISKVGH